MTTAVSSPSKRPAKAEEIISVAQSFIQKRGYNGFSFRDVADAVGVKSASIHYHFPTKSDLVREVVSNYRAEFQLALDAIDARNLSGFEKLKSYAGLFEHTFRKKGCVCLAGVLATEIESLDDKVRTEISAFFSEQTVWITNAIHAGQAEGNIQQTIDAKNFAPAFVSSLEGAMIIARGTGAMKHLSNAASQYLSMIKT